MKKKSNLYQFLALCSCTMICLFVTMAAIADSAPENGEIKILQIPAQSLKHNLIGTPVIQPCGVYLPPSYHETDKRYPVVYFLPGFGDNVEHWFYGAYQGFAIRSVMDSLISQKN
ncbi:MAG: hypothetical protein HKM93_08780 [Desulfobacteraceae bacterium]|nr:hypothetical protein [Desulfobacteraceae bacterium]